MEEEIPAIGPFGTFVAVFCDTLSTIQFSSVGDTFYNVDVQSVRVPLGVRKDRL
jgi:hypothetical protein